MAGREVHSAVENPLKTITCFAVRRLLTSQKVHIMSVCIELRGLT